MDGRGAGRRPARRRPPPASRRRARRGRDDRIAALVGGLVELDRWLEDRVRIGLADPSIARFATWDEVARRLTDARAGALANRVRRLAGRVGAEPEWHAHVLAEIGILHLLAQRRPAGAAAAERRSPTASPWRAGGRCARPTSRLPSPRPTAGWSSDAATRERTSSRCGGCGSAASSRVAGRWCCRSPPTASRSTTRWSPEPSSHADIHRYPGSSQRALVGVVAAVDATPSAAHAAASVAATTTAGVCDLVGTVLAAEPWLERVPAVVTAAVTRSGGAWLLTDDGGSLPIAAESARSDAVATLLAASAGAPVRVAVEWTACGFLPITVFLDDRTIDIGPRADASFVSAA